jgi:hypothetical protein
MQRRSEMVARSRAAFRINVRAIVSQAEAIGAAALGTGAAVAAGIACACCVGPALAPILLALLGSGGLIAVSTVRPYAPWMLAGSAVLLAFSFRQTHRKLSCTSGEAAMPIPPGVRIARVITWLAIVLWLASAAYALYGVLNE